jgi:hypothetical protein
LKETVWFSDKLSKLSTNTESLFEQEKTEVGNGNWIIKMGKWNNQNEKMKKSKWEMK